MADTGSRRRWALVVALYLGGFFILGAAQWFQYLLAQQQTQASWQLAAGLDSLRVAAVQSREAATEAREAQRRIDENTGIVLNYMRELAGQTRSRDARLEGKIEGVRTSVDSVKVILPPPRRK